MKIVTESEIIPEHEVTETYYVADDGTTFRIESQCKEYENRQRILKAPVFANRIKEVFSFNGGDTVIDTDCEITLFHIRNNDDYDMLMRHWTKNGKIVSDYDQYGPGWYVGYIDYGGDYWADHFYLYNYDHYEQSLVTNLNKWTYNMRAMMQEVEKKEDKQDGGNSDG